MANSCHHCLSIFVATILIISIKSLGFDEFSIIDYDNARSSSEPSPPANISRFSCEDLHGIGSLSTTCELSFSLNFTTDVYVEGSGNLYILPGVALSCVELGCSIMFNVSGWFELSRNAGIVAGSVYVVAMNVNLLGGSVINVTGLAGKPPETKGTPDPDDAQGCGGGHGGRGASCVMDNKKLPEDIFGGDTYSWGSLQEPWSYGSKGGSTSKDVDYGGLGGGRIWLEANNTLNFLGLLEANGGDGGVQGGGASGGSVHIKSTKMVGSGIISASGGNGFAGGGGGRVSVKTSSSHDSLTFLVHGGRSFGCPLNAGAAGTFYDAVPRRLIISNHNFTTDTDTILKDFPNQPLWTNVYIQDRARATVPLLWSRVQVRGQLSLSSGAFLSFGLVHFALSEFELIAQELLMSDSVIKVYGALRMSVKIHLMLNSKLIIDGDQDVIVATTLLEASNVLMLKGSSVISSNANLGVHGQGSLNLSGPGDLIEAQHLVVSLFYTINVGPGSILRNVLDDANNNYTSPMIDCELHTCPVELLHPPEDCNVNASLAFTLQICRVEDVIVNGVLEGSVLHFHWVRSLIVKSSGVISVSGMGCIGGLGRGTILPNGVSSGAGHGGRGGDTYYDGEYVDGGPIYGNQDLPCEFGSGSGNDSHATAGGGIIVMGSPEHPLSSLLVHGSLRADGTSIAQYIPKQDSSLVSVTGSGGGSGGTILLFVRTIILKNSSTISSLGGHGSLNSGGGAGGRIHFHWSDILVGDEFVPIATIKGTITVWGGIGRGLGKDGGNGTVSGKACPEGLFGIFCRECPIGTYKNITGSARELCRQCPSLELPRRAIYIAVRGGVSTTPCPYRCISERYHMPHCYTALDELIYTFGGPWLFGFTLLILLVLLALVLSVARMKFVSTDDLPSLVPARRTSPIDHSFPFLESLNEVLETNRTEESETHVHRMYFMGANTFSDPWHLPHSPPQETKEIVYEDTFNRFVDEINSIATYQWWEGSVYSILSVLAYPLAWSWLQWCRTKKIQRLREFVRSEYDHACLRSCRSRALYEGLKLLVEEANKLWAIPIYILLGRACLRAILSIVELLFTFLYEEVDCRFKPDDSVTLPQVAATSDMLAYVDFFLGGDEKRADLPPRLLQRLPMSVVFGGNGSYMTPFSVHSDNILTRLMSQSVAPTIWHRLIAGLNAQLRVVRCGHLRDTVLPVINWLETHANPTLRSNGLRVEFARFPPSASGHRQFGLVISAAEDQSQKPAAEGVSRSKVTGSLPGSRWRKALNLVRVNEQASMPNKTQGEILNAKSLSKLEANMSFDCLFYFVVKNTKPIRHQDLVGLVISILLLGDFSLVLLTLLQLYSISMWHVILTLSILPLGILLPFPAGINALFSHGPRRSAGLARVYALWNITSMINVVVAFTCEYVHYKSQSSSRTKQPYSWFWNFTMDESGWWMLPTGLVLFKFIQARLINYHIANLEVQDRTLYSSDPNVFWRS